jgi:hypothetical protein
MNVIQSENDSSQWIMMIRFPSAPSELQRMIAEAVLGKKTTRPTLVEKIKEAMKASVGTKIADSYITPIYDNINYAFEEWNASGSKKTNQLKETLRTKLKEFGVFKFSDATLDQFLDIFESRTINVYCRPIESKDDPLYKEYLSNILESVRNTLERSLSDEPMWGVFLDEKQADGTMKTFLPTILIKVSDDLIWIPASPDTALTASGEELKRVDLTKMFQPLYELLFPTRKDRGIVRVIGPRGGEHLCGEIFSSRERAEIKDKTINLANEYKMTLFVTN